MNPYLILLACYLLGAVQFGLLVGKLWKGIDLRQYGSGNVGATNALRTLGPVPAALVFIADVAKGAVPVAVCRLAGFPPSLVVLGGMLAVLGHIFSIFSRFTGGKGAATGLGVLLGLSPAVGFTAFALWLAVVTATRYISLASIVGALSVPVWMWAFRLPLEYRLFGIAAALLVVVRHKSNIRRLMAGTEPRFGEQADIRKE
ncbi:MAG: glycerol-3-phosphate 1-O-acyltransferase PlsY [Armatimonadetes bacterium]|nr:glycerol-3-phosphate 1-O-acyltransferase PlsY [Armatimonadota bacterium]